jgi:aminomuconate-semialdehyde/2-hydroxymuconate-6-semialdehyde dehydrogenase
MKDIRNFIDGSYVTNSTGKTFEKRTPVDNSVIGLVHEAGEPEVDAAVAAARAALRAVGDHAGHQPCRPVLDQQLVPA